MQTEYTIAKAALDTALKAMLRIDSSADVVKAELEEARHLIEMDQASETAWHKEQTDMLDRQHAGRIEAIGKFVAQLNKLVEAIEGKVEPVVHVPEARLTADVVVLQEAAE